MTSFCSIEPFPFDCLPACLRVSIGTKDQLSQDSNELGSLKEEITVADQAKRDDWEICYCWMSKRTWSVPYLLKRHTTSEGIGCQLASLLAVQYEIYCTVIERVDWLVVTCWYRREVHAS